MKVLGVVRDNSASKLRDHFSFPLFQLVLVWELVYPRPLYTSGRGRSVPGHIQLQMGDAGPVRRAVCLV